VLDANLTFHGVLIQDNGDRTRILADLLGRQVIRPVIAGVYPLERAAEAHRRLESRHSSGKTSSRSATSRPPTHPRGSP
jgi:NADPH:quinone reductase-like Zn-dependent oxidoreductase